MGLQIRGLAADPFAEHFTHPPDERPYRMVVFGGFSGHNAPLYWVAGEGDKLLGARKAVSCATEKHGERCFYCDGKGELTIEHILPSALGGTDARENLVICCKRCNQDKGARALACFKPSTAARWAAARKAHHQRQLDRLVLARIEGRPD